MHGYCATCAVVTFQMSVWAIIAADLIEESFSTSLWQKLVAEVIRRR
jgi:hypothetical protein